MLRAATLLGVALGAPPAMAVTLPDGSDSVVVDLMQACEVAIAAGGGWTEELVAEGWTGSAMNDDSQAYLNHDEMFGDREFAGIGAAHLVVSVDRYAGLQLGRCSIRFDGASAGLPFGDIGKAEGLVGSYEDNGEVAEGAWRNEAGTLFIQALQIAEFERIRFSVTRIDEMADAVR